MEIKNIRLAKYFLEIYYFEIKEIYYKIKYQNVLLKNICIKNGAIIPTRNFEKIEHTLKTILQDKEFKMSFLEFAEHLEDS